MNRLLVLATAMIGAATAGARHDWQRLSDGVVVNARGLHVRVRACSDRIVRVTAWPDGAPEPSRPSLAVVAHWAPVPFDVRADAREAVLSTPRLRARVALDSGQVSFEDASGRPLLREPASGGKTFRRVSTQGETTYEVSQAFATRDDEGLYGLGQHQDRLLDLRGRDLDLWQHNREIVIPTLVSSRGWGLLWDNPSHTLLIDYWSLFVRADEAVRVPLEANRRYRLKIEWQRGDANAPFDLRWRPPRAARRPARLWSASGEGLDYYFIQGPSLDDVIAGYREATGRAPLLPKWAYGYWQSLERYHSAAELLDVVREFRRRRFPLDVIVQDWRYGRDQQWGTHEFDPARFPDPKGMVDEVHRLDAGADLGLAQVRQGDGELRGDAEGRLPLPLHPRPRHQGLARRRVLFLRRVQSRGAQAVLGADQGHPLREGFRRLVDRCRRAQPHRRPDARRAGADHQPDGARPGGPRPERLSGRPHGWTLRRAPRGRARAQGRDPHPFGLGR
jgi:hypothetical protein